MLNKSLMSQTLSTMDVDYDLPKSSQDSLMDAAWVALDTGDITPLVKEELKLTIQSRRLASGKGELRVNFDAPTQSEVRERERERERERDVGGNVEKVTIESAFFKFCS